MLRVVEANLVTCPRKDLSADGVCMSGAQKVSFSDQKAPSLLNANVFICPFPSLCVCLGCTSGHFVAEDGRRGALCALFLFFSPFLQNWKEKKDPAGAGDSPNQLFSGWGCRSICNAGQKSACRMQEQYDRIDFIFRFMFVAIVVVPKLQSLHFMS